MRAGILSINDYHELGYHFGTNLVRSVSGPAVNVSREHLEIGMENYVIG